jgi:hypothetical protein
MEVEIASYNMSKPPITGLSTIPYLNMKSEILILKHQNCVDTAVIIKALMRRLPAIP